jgi:hypothetical protein
MREDDLLKLSPDEARAALSESTETQRRSAAYTYEARHGVRLYSEPASTPGDNVGVAVPNSGGAWAWIMILIGAGLAGWSFIFDVGMATGAGSEFGLPDRVANLDKIAFRHMILASGLGLFICGHILLASERLSSSIRRLKT